MVFTETIRERLQCLTPLVWELRPTILGLEEEEETEKRGFDSSVEVQPQWVKKSSELEKMQYLLDQGSAGHYHLLRSKVFNKQIFCTEDQT